VTTICYRDGIIAADSRSTYEGEYSGTRVARCEKLYRKYIGKKGRRHEVIIGVSGESSPALVFLDWYDGTTKPIPDPLKDMDADFCALIYSKYGLFEVDAYCRPERVLEEFWAVGSGSKAALGAMHAGCTARQAVAIACKIDPYSAPPITFMSLKK
jgi:ATP-dependent protease HslVU (ClpYQ) peptidase subunit